MGTKRNSPPTSVRKLREDKSTWRTSATAPGRARPGRGAPRRLGGAAGGSPPRARWPRWPEQTVSRHPRPAPPRCHRQRGSACAARRPCLVDGSSWSGRGRWSWPGPVRPRRTPARDRSGTGGKGPGSCPGCSRSAPPLAWRGPGRRSRPAAPRTGAEWCSPVPRKPGPGPLALVLHCYTHHHYLKCGAPKGGYRDIGQTSPYIFMISMPTRLGVSSIDSVANSASVTMSANRQQLRSQKWQKTRNAPGVSPTGRVGVQASLNSHVKSAS